MQENTAAFSNLYKLLAMMGVIERKEDVIPGFKYKGSRITLAFPNAKFGIAFQGDKVTDLVDDGWKIERLTTHHLDPFAKVFDVCDTARIELEKRKMDPNVKMTSMPEEMVLNEIMRRMLPIPDRNYKFKREDGTELTTPDFTWEQYKIAFFLDGSYWHSIKGDKEIIKKIKADKKKQNDLVIQRSDKARKDGQIRSELGSMGWIVLSCTDGDVETQDGINRVVDLIERTMSNVESSRQIIVDPSASDNDDEFESLFDPVEENSVDESSGVTASDNGALEDGPTPQENPLQETTVEKEVSVLPEESMSNSEMEKQKHKGSIFDQIGDYDHEDQPMDPKETNNYSDSSEEPIDLTEVAESTIKQEEKPEDIDIEKYDLLDDVFLDPNTNMDELFFSESDSEE